MGYAIKVYEAFKDDEVKAKVLSEFIEKVEQAISNNQLTTKEDLRITELKLTKEIEQVRLELTKEIEQVRAELRETELKLTKEIEQVRLELNREIEKVRLELTKEIEQVRVEVYKVKSSILKWLVALFLTQTITIVGIIIGLFQAIK